MLLFPGKMALSLLEVDTKGWEFLVSWIDGSYSWMDLAILKESYPVQVAGFAYSARINQEPAFKWWVHKVLRKRDRMIGKCKS